MKEYIMRIFERKPGDISTEHCIASLEIRKDNLKEIAELLNGYVKKDTDHP